MTAIRGAERERLLQEGTLVVIPLGQVGPGVTARDDAAVSPHRAPVPDPLFFYRAGRGWRRRRRVLAPRPGSGRNR